MDWRSRRARKGSMAAQRFAGSGKSALGASIRAQRRQWQTICERARRQALGHPNLSQ